MWDVYARGNKRGPNDLVEASYSYSVVVPSPDASNHLTNLLSQRFLPFCGPLGFGLFAPSLTGPFLAQPTGLFLATVVFAGVAHWPCRLLLYATLAVPTL